MKVKKLNYFEDAEKSPHIVKFSGGRSSGAMLLLLCEKEYLDPTRGDVVLFANTSAEHPGTYDFAAECSKTVEEEFGVPVFWYEFCTVEDTSNSGMIVRRSSYRLVQKTSLETNSEGYRSHGEVFEEMLSYQKMLPNPQSRSCTAKMKLFPGHQLLEEWLSGVDETAHAGRCTADIVAGLSEDENVASYEKKNGSLTAEEYKSISAYCWKQPAVRSSQRWEDFTSAPIKIASWTDNYNGGMFSKNPVKFVTLLGLRHDESRRVNRIKARSFFAEGAGSKACQITTQPPGEMPYFPLDEWKMNKEDVLNFWGERDFDLEIPEEAGNCVYCFMKGTQKLAELHITLKNSKNKSKTNGALSPVDIEWWEQIENRYARTTPARDGSGDLTFGFFGASPRSFADIKKGSVSSSDRYAASNMSCDCSD